nr:acyltransferase [uncultured Draconibacterium sp.]
MLEEIVWKIKLITYYLIISKLPHSRLLGTSNKLRVWYLSKILHICPFDPNTKIENNIYISDGKELKIGNYCRINEDVFLQGSVQIGNFVMIAPNVTIHSSTHNYENTEIPMVKQGLSDNKKVIIEDDVWIGRNVVILPGLRIGQGSIVAANAVVNKNVEPYSVIGGVPAKLIKKRK